MTLSGVAISEHYTGLLKAFMGVSVKRKFVCACVRARVRVSMFALCLSPMPSGCW